MKSLTFKNALHTDTERDVGGRGEHTQTAAKTRLKREQRYKQRWLTTELDQQSLFALTSQSDWSSWTIIWSKTLLRLIIVEWNSTTSLLLWVIDISTDMVSAFKTRYYCRTWLIIKRLLSVDYGTRSQNRTFGIQCVRMYR